jgi:hydrogenase maturation protein HypF
MTAPIAARRIEVRGIVQGVGFRPFVCRLASDKRIKGWVLNDHRGVTIHAEGARSDVEAFVSALQAESPDAAKVTSIEAADTQPQRLTDFQIHASQQVGAATAKISPDLAVCADCLEELHNPESPRFHYPYINCTACGPRYSIVNSLPYDRAHTTMSAWALCDSCQTEYDNPLDRRHHAQPTACHRCGPTYRLAHEGDRSSHGTQAISEAARLLRKGSIVAVKGIGGYHLACDALDGKAIQRLRQRKFRKEKPFALMVRDLETAQSIATLEDQQIALLTSAARPIVLATSKVRFPGVAPETDEVGLMLPYAPLHNLLFHFGAPNPLVLTSANRSNEPIAYLDEDAVDRLGGIADAFLVGERPIARRVDDSVMAVRDGQTAMIRRARGYAPNVVARLPTERPILALGADLKNTIALVVDGDVMVSQHIGDLGDLESDRAFEQTVRDLLSMYDVRQRDLVVVHDLHPEFVSTRFAKSLDCGCRLAVQHHRAHIASVLAERGALDLPVVGVALDGTGYGDDGTIWGFEIFAGSVVAGFERIAHLPSVLMPGGDAAARHPIQAAAGFLASLDRPDLHAAPFFFPKRFDRSLELVSKGVRCFRSSSAGRLFDTVAALCGFVREITFEGQAAMWLENKAHAANRCEPYLFPDFDFRPMLESVISDRIAGRPIEEIAYAFHAALARSILFVAARIADQRSLGDCVLSGGVFQNRLLRSLLEDEVRGIAPLKLHFNREIPTNDGGIAVGQAALACGQLC